MQFNLCYKQYSGKINLAACKSFYEQTGKDLNYTLLRYLEATRETAGMDGPSRLQRFLGLENFAVIAKLFHCIIMQEDKSIPLAEIEDCMFRVGWMPTDNDDEMCDPWPMVVIELASKVSEYYAVLDKKKVIT